MDEWTYFTPAEELYEITVFDDGHQMYERYENKWLIYGNNWQGKRALVNYKDPSIKINSISEWKIVRLCM
jgi:hypothetical protein